MSPEEKPTIPNVDKQPPQFDFSELKLPNEAVKRKKKKSGSSASTYILFFIIFLLMTVLGGMLYWAFSTGMLSMSDIYPKATEQTAAENKEQEVTEPTPLPTVRDSKPAFEIVPGRPRAEVSSSTASSTATSTDSGNSSATTTASTSPAT